MNLKNVDLEKLSGIMKATALEVLGGEAGNDHMSWTDDIVQDSMIKVLEYDKEVEDVYNLGKVIAFRLACNFKTKEENRRSIEEKYGEAINSTLTGQSAEILAADPYEIMAYEEMRERLDDLSPLLYSTTYRHYIEGRSVESIAEEDGCTEDVIYKRLQRARNFVSEGINGEAN